MSRLSTAFIAAIAASAAILPARAQDAFEELQGQVEQQLRDQGRDPDLGSVPTPDTDVEPEQAPGDEAPGTDAGVGDLPSQATGERVKKPVAVFSGLDKITGKITSFDVYIDETVQFGALQVTPKVCYASVEGEAAKTDAFVQVDEITLERDIRQIFSGWMFADSPGLNAVEHPVYDVWLKSCKTDSDVPAPAG